VVLPETSLEQGQRVAEAAAAALTAQAAENGLRPELAVSEYQVFSSGTAHDQPADDGGTTVLLVAAELGAYQQDTEADLGRGDVRAVPDDPADPVLYGVHTAWPHPLEMETWSADVERAAGYCAAEAEAEAESESEGETQTEPDDGPGAVVAGDVNATRDHAPFDPAPCRSALEDTEVTGDLAGEGTWPAFAPAVLGAAIDHVLVDPARWSTFSARLETVPGSDHRAVATVLVPEGSTDPGPSDAETTLDGESPT
jgi:hypothetical protein